MVTALDVNSKDQNLRSSCVALRKSGVLCTPESCQEDAMGLGIADLRNFGSNWIEPLLLGVGVFGRWSSITVQRNAREIKVRFFCLLCLPRTHVIKSGTEPTQGSEHGIAFSQQWIWIISLQFTVFASLDKSLLNLLQTLSFLELK